LLDILKEKSDHIDEDKTFSFSCVPTFKNPNDDQKYWAKMEVLGIVRKAKNMVFQPQYAQCFTAITSLPQTYEYNFQSQNTSTVSHIPNNRTVNSPAVSDHLDTGFSWFPWVQERMLRWFPPFQVASTYFSCSSPE
jgi:hypothetical protein